MKNIRKYMNICWLIGCKEEFNDSGYSICHCGKDYYYDYDAWNAGLINIIRDYPKNTFEYIKEEFEKSIKAYVGFCYDCKKIDFWFGKRIEKGHEKCFPF